MSLPRREDPELPGDPRARALLLLRLRRGRGRHHLPAEEGEPVLRRGGRAAGRPVQRAAPLRRRRWPHLRLRQSAPTHRGEPARGGVLRPPADHPGRARGAAFPRRPRLRSAGGRAFRDRLRAARRPRPAQLPAAAGVPRRGTGAGRPGPGERRLGLLPGPPDLADPRRRRRGARVRGPAAVRRRPVAGEVHQHPRDHRLQEVARAVRPRPGPPADREEVPGGGRGGLHRCDGGAPVRGRHRGRVLRHGVRRRPRPDPAAVDRSDLGHPGRGGLHLRRRCGRAGSGAEGLPGRREFHHPDVRRGGAARLGPVRPADQRG
ncbi:hypothetical protein SDC9_100675 [bioreactor metagenome]|uniref:Uncharacterized protein n=1 Tax=bioreactor metagenome TaxID=1076179 RepID=A0A645AL06_9ZZZZ